MARFGYIRVSSKDQNPERQKELMKNLDIDYCYVEKKSGASLENREELKKILDMLRIDDVLVVSELDRLSRKADDLTYIINKINEKQARLEVINLPTTQVSDKNLSQLLNNLIIEIYKYIAENERIKIKERQRQGIELAKQKNKYKGRKKKYNKDSPQLIMAFGLIDNGASIRQASASTGISYETLRRYLKQREE